MLTDREWTDRQRADRQPDGQPKNMTPLLPIVGGSGIKINRWYYLPITTSPEGVILNTFAFLKWSDFDPLTNFDQLLTVECKHHEDWLSKWWASLNSYIIHVYVTSHVPALSY